LQPCLALLQTSCYRQAAQTKGEERPHTCETIVHKKGLEFPVLGNSLKFAQFCLTKGD
jgi:hypothetical protein